MLKKRNRSCAGKLLAFVCALCVAGAGAGAAPAQGDLTSSLGQFAVQPKKERTLKAVRPKVERPAATAPVPRANAVHEKLLRAAGDGDLAQAREVLARGANVNYKGKSGATPLLLAAASDSAP